MCFPSVESVIFRVIPDLFLLPGNFKLSVKFAFSDILKIIGHVRLQPESLAEVWVAYRT